MLGKVRLVQIIVTNNGRAGEEQPTAADEPHTEPSDDVCATAPAEKRSRVVSGVSETQGTADLPAAGLSPEKPKTKAARTRTRKLKDLTSESELAAPSSHVCTCTLIPQ